MNSNEVNERFIQVRGKVSTDDELELGQDLQVVVTVTGIEDKDNEDGTVNRIYKCRLFNQE